MQIGSLIRRAARYYGDAPCLTDCDVTVSFNQFDQLTDRAGNALLALGLEPGDRVGVLMPNSIECLVVYYALAKAGLVRVGLNSREKLESHNYKLKDSGSRCLIYASEYGSILDGDISVEITLDSEQLQAEIDAANSAPCAIDRALAAPYRLGYTGGTTGAPKGVTLTTQGELAELSAFLMDLVPDLREGDRFLHAAPIAHASGAFFLPVLVRGGHALIMSKFDTGDFLRYVREDKADMTFLVPTMLAMILEEPALVDSKSKLRRICYGASSMAPGILRRGEQHFGRVFTQVYGQAESPMAITHLQPGDHDRAGSCGRPFTFVEAAIFDENDAEAAVGEIGEIVCRGPQVMSHYWQRPEATEKAFKNGWLHTGDLGYMDQDGFFYIADRKNDMLISGGFNVYPNEVEQVLLEFEGVVDAAVVGLPDEKWGDRVYGVVAGRDGLDVDALLAHAAEKLATFKRPKGIEVWPELPKSGANKILRREIRDTLVKRLSQHPEG